MTKATVAIVEDDELVRAGLQRIINKSEEFVCDHTYTNAEDAVLFLPKHPPAMVLMDIHLPGMNGIECITKLRELLPDTLFMMCTTSADEAHVFEALKAGAVGYLVKDLSPGDLLSSLEELQSGGSPMSPGIARMVVKAFQPSVQKKKELPNDLTERELELLHLLSEGLRYKEIGDKLFISPKTVKKHCQNIYRKLQVQSRTEALNKVFAK